MKKIFQYIMLAVVTIVMASCTSDIEETTTTTGNSNVQLVVGEFPAFGDSQTRAIGTPDEGKTSWAVGDELLLEMTSNTLGTKYAAFKYNGSNWELASGELSYKEDEVPTFLHVYYAPNYKWEAGKLVLKEGKDPGTDEYIEGKAKITSNREGINVSFAEATRNYSRLRIATMPNTQITFNFNYFTPAGSSNEVFFGNYTLTSDEKGNAYIYGTFKLHYIFEVKYRGALLATHHFYGPTENAKSYALDATVISANSAEEIKSAIEKEVANGKTAIRLNIASDAGDNEFKAIREAFENVQDATIDLTLIGCKEIPADGLNNEYEELSALKSISLSDVTTLGERALFGCYNLETVNAPNVTAIYEQAFYDCQELREVTLGTLTDVRGEADSGFGIFDRCLSRRTILYLPESQEIMQGEFDKNSNQYIWKPTGEKYFDSQDHDNGIFLGYQFGLVKSWE